MSTDLDSQVRQLLEARRGDWKVIAEHSDVSHSWISQFVRGLIPNPGFATLKRISEHLTSGKQAEVGGAKVSAHVPESRESVDDTECRLQKGAVDGTLCLRTALPMSRQSDGTLQCAMCAKQGEAQRDTKAEAKAA